MFCLEENITKLLLSVRPIPKVLVHPLLILMRWKEFKTAIVPPSLVSNKFNILCESVAFSMAKKSPVRLCYSLTPVLRSH